MRSGSERFTSNTVGAMAGEVHMQSPMLLKHPSFSVGLPDRRIFNISCRLLARSPSSTCSGFGSGAIWRPVSSPSLFSQPFLKVPAETRQVLGSQVYTVPLPTSSSGLQGCFQFVLLNFGTDNSPILVRFEFLNALRVKSPIFWNMMPFNSLKANGNFGRK
jgi:hypothetical protein